jgi:hypothetical protein
MCISIWLVKGKEGRKLVRDFVGMLLYNRIGESGNFLALQHVCSTGDMGLPNTQSWDRQKWDWELLKQNISSHRRSAPASISVSQ